MAIIKKRKIESIFDHEINDREIKTMYGISINKIIYLSNFGNTDDKRNGDLYKLYMVRNQRKKATEFLDKVLDSAYKYNLCSLADSIK